MKYSNEIESKEERLRQVVGDSYRDLISSADAIESIAEQCEEASKRLEGLVRLIGSQDVVDDVVGEPSMSRGHDEEAFTMASNVKFIVDSQETIYGHVDRHEYCMAAVRYLKAIEMHKDFEKSTKYAEYGKQFPFLEHMWPSVKKLDGDIWNKGQSWLAQQDSVSGDDVAGVLACFSLLRPVDGMDLLKYFLTARHDSIVGKIRRQVNSADQGEGDGIAYFVQKAIENMWSVVCIVFDMFSEQGPGPIQKILERVEADSFQQDKEGSWFLRRVDDAASKLLSSISQGSLQLESEDWLLKTSSDIKDALEPWLLSVETCSQLKQIDATVQAGLSNWTGVLHEGKQSREVTIVSISQYSTGKTISLWGLTCQSSIVARAKTIVKEKFAMIERVANNMVHEMAAESMHNTIELRDPLVSSNDEERVSKKWWVGLSRKYFEEANVMLEDALCEALECVSFEESKSISAGREKSAPFEDFVSEEFGSLIGKIVTTFDSATSNQTLPTVGMSLTIVHFTSLLLHSCDSFEKFLHFQELGNNTDIDIVDLRSLQLHPWARETRKSVKSVCGSANAAWATWCSEQIANHVCSQQRPSTTSNSVVGDSDDEVSAPMYPSKWLTDAITYFCAELDNSGGLDAFEDLVKQAMAIFKTTMVSSAIDIERKLSKEMSKYQSLQRIYDMKFINILFWEDKGIAAPMKNEIQDLVNQIDPVEWARFGNDLDDNVVKYASSAACLLRLRTQNVSITKGSNSEHDVCMDLATSQSRFAYLPAKLPSKSQLMPSYTIPSPADSEDLLKGQENSISSSAQNAITSLLGTKAAEVGGLLGSFNFPSFTH